MTYIDNKSIPPPDEQNEKTNSFGCIFGGTFGTVLEDIWRYLGEMFGGYFGGVLEGF